MVWQVVQSASGSTASGTTVTTTFGSNVRAGSVLIAVTCNSQGSSVTSSVADSHGNQFQLFWNDTAENLSGWMLPVPIGDVGTKPAVTATFPVTVSYVLLIQEVSGIFAAIEGSASGSKTAYTSSATAGPPAFSDSEAGEYLLYVLGCAGSSATTWTGPSGYTLDQSSVNSAAVDIAAAYRSSTGGTESGS